MSLVYVFGHELTHALAAWMSGAKVHAFKAGAEGGHVDLSSSNAFIALAPYCLPVYTVAVIFSYRAVLWLKPALAGESVFLLLIGLTLAFHALYTVECLWDLRQPDLAAAGGLVFSLALILLANAAALLLLLKALFPGLVALTPHLEFTWKMTAGFWGGVLTLATRARAVFAA